MTALRPVVLLFLFAALSCDRQTPPIPDAPRTSIPATETAEKHQVRLQGKTMGTTYHLTIVRPPMPRDDFKKLDKKIREVVESIDKKMSTFLPDSEVSRFNRALPGEMVSVSEMTMEVVIKALEVAKLSGGAFDPTVAPLVELWGFGASPPRKDAPSRDEIDEAALRVDFSAVVIDPASMALRKTREGIRLDLSAIAKGYAVDRIWMLLAAEGFGDFMVEIGGEVRAKGRNRRGEPWQIGVDRPVFGARLGENLQFIVSLRDMAMATSGDYRNFRELKGRRISHTIDPALKGPIRHNLASVTVLAGNCMEADALATAVSVLGVEKGLRLVESLPNVEAYLITRTAKGEFQTRLSSGFAAKACEECEGVSP